MTSYRFIVCILLLPFSALAQSRPSVKPSAAAATPQRLEVPRQISLEKAEEILLQHNLAITAARYGIDVARAQRLVASLKPNPTVTFAAEAFDVGHLGRDLFTTNPDSAANRLYTFRYDQVLERGNKRKLRTEVADAQLQAAEAQWLDVTRQQLFQLK